MKYTILLFILSFSSSLFAQFNIKIHTGYGFDLSPEGITDGTITAIKDELFLFESVEFSYGTGLSFSGEVEYQLSDQMGIGLMASYLYGKEHSFSSLFATEDRANESYMGKMLRIVPKLNLYILNKKKFNLFSEVGFVFGVSGKIIQKSEVINLLDVIESEREYHYSGGYSYGIFSAVGGEYMLNEKLSLICDLSFYGQSFAPQKGELVKYFKNGVSELESLSVANRKTNFVSKYTEDFTNDPTVPDTQIKKYYPFSSFGINIGLRYQFKRTQSQSDGRTNL